MWKSSSAQYRRDKVALRVTCMRNVKYRIIKIRTVCQYVGYLYQFFSTFFASRTTLCNKKILGNTKQNFIITIMMFSSVLAL